MTPIRKRILTDENNQPVAVQIDYADWLEIEKALGSRAAVAPSTSARLARLRGSFTVTEDAVALQRRWRGVRAA